MTAYDELNAMVEALASGDMMAAAGIADLLEELDDPRTAEARHWADLIVTSESTFTIFVAHRSLLSLFYTKPEESHV